MRPEDLTWAGPGRAPFDGKSGIALRWLRTAGFALEHGGHVVLVDPYLTRASLGRCLFGHIAPNQELLRRELPRADAIILGHTHFDHALDVPALARSTGARVFGSRSAMALCRAGGVPAAQLECVEPDVGGGAREAEVGTFRLRFRPSAHATHWGRVPFGGEIADCEDVPARATKYRCGAVFDVELLVGGRRIYHVGSSEVMATAAQGAAGCDLALVCATGWTGTKQYPERVMAALSPGAVLLHHWDNFLRPFSEPARALPGLKLPRLVDRLHAVDGRLPIGTLPLGGTIQI